MHPRERSGRGLYWLARMLEAGEDPLYVARRLIRFASEDVGLADPEALRLAVAVKDTVHFLGMPEANTRSRSSSSISRSRRRATPSIARTRRRRDAMEKPPYPVPSGSGTRRRP
jgi:putative ATPase